MPIAPPTEGKARFSARVVGHSEVGLKRVRGKSAKLPKRKRESAREHNANSGQVSAEPAESSAPDQRTTIDPRRSALAPRTVRRDRATRRASAPRIPSALSIPP